MKQAPPKPITISPELAERYTNPDQFKRFDAAVRKVLTVTHAEILRREADARAEAAVNPRRRGPKAKNASRVPAAVQPLS